MAEVAKKLPTKVYIAYTFQEFAMGFMTNMGTQYFPFFLTDVAMLDAAVVATILLIGRVVDTIDVPIIGAIVERSNLPWGKYRSWLFVAPPLIVLFFMLAFTNLNVSVPIKTFYLAAAYILGFVFVNFTSTARFTMLPTFTSDQNERAALSAKRGQGAALGQLVRGEITLPLIAFLGQGNDAKGYFYTTIVFGLVTIAGLYWIAYLAKDYDRPYIKGRPSASLKEMISAVATNRPLLFLVLADTFRGAARQVLVGLGMYYFRYVVGDLMLFALYAPITSAASLLGSTASQYLSAKRDKKFTYQLGIVIWIIGMVMIYLFAGSNAAIFIGCVALAQFGAALPNAQVTAFYSDTADYSEWKTGKSTKALNMSIQLLPIKAGVTIGGSIAAYGLVFIGFRAGEVSPEVVQGIRILISLVPSIVGLLGMLFMKMYSLDRDTMQQIQAELRQRASAT